MTDNQTNFKRGMIDGLSIAIGYFAVSFTLGISGSNAGLKWYQSALMSALNYTSAGQAAAIDIMKEGGSILLLVLSTIVINLRYLLMSAALAVKLSPSTGIGKRMIMGIAVTDEIFGIASSQKYPLNPFYNYGAMALSCPGWILGTILGAVMGEILPPFVTSALSVALYAMFLAIIIPPSKNNKTIALVVILSMVLSYSFTLIPLLKTLSSGMRVIIVTLLISTLASILFPLKEEELEDL